MSLIEFLETTLSKDLLIHSQDKTNFLWTSHTGFEINVSGAKLSRWDTQPSQTFYKTLDPDTKFMNSYLQEANRPNLSRENIKIPYSKDSQHL